MTRRVEALELNRCANANDVARTDADVHIRYAPTGISMRDDFCAGFFDETRVAADVIAMLVRVQNLPYRPAALTRGVAAATEIERVDSERLAGLRARHQVVEIAQGVIDPDLLDDHRESSCTYVFA